MEPPEWSAVADLSGSPLVGDQLETLVGYRDWLASEAIKHGALGPQESGRLEKRHIGDSLLFSLLLDQSTSEVWDLGSGAGLPGIPLAILRPQTQFVLIDRSRSRVDLLRRLIRILELDNVEVVHQDVFDLDREIGCVVSRAAIPAGRAYPLVRRLLQPGGTAIFGGSWSSAPQYQGWETLEVGSEVLDQPVWLLIMRRR